MNEEYSTSYFKLSNYSGISTSLHINDSQNQCADIIYKKN